MPPGRILRVGYFRSFFHRSAPAPVLPLTGRSVSPSSALSRRLTIPHTARIRNPLTIRSFTYSPEPREETVSLTQRLKILIKTHGWYALGVYTVLTALDFTLCFAVIYFLGAEQVNRLVQPIRTFINEILHRQTDPLEPTDSVGTSPNGSGSDGLYAIAILAYGIHKTLLLPVRVGLTAALTPKLVSFLTARGWVGKGGATRAAIHVRERVKAGVKRDK
ncbi:uncharacterized protein EI90DRAFT_1329769 [Cantharellus anzutake]|uniref:uncharacterized protein n=1 Tax=Cantharellus anzutake TaxID=1750568 RepID=UPI0019053FE9|nr:uncharacterized protein EI90DRAFT_1329769 [Cantharellus anzutake]KAF8342310.1 hypothetical protein EI90DRAFT_1329769 [Cantharellus anzutake]